MATLLATVEQEHWPEVAARTALGCRHEEQHQELFLTDIKYNFAVNPLKPAYREDLPAAPAGAGTALRWIEQAGGTMDIGHDGAGFAFDNEGPRHRSLLAPYALASRLVTNGEYLEFIKAGGYERSEFLAGVSDSNRAKAFTPRIRTSTRWRSSTRWHAAPVCNRAKSGWTRRISSAFTTSASSPGRARA